MISIKEATLDEHLQRLNEKPVGDHVEVFASDYNKDFWSFYTYISTDQYEDDLDQIAAQIDRLNYRDGDTYVELINYEGDVGNFYHYLYDRGRYAHWDALNKAYWEALAERGDDHFLILRECFGPQYHSTPEEAGEEENYSVFEDYDDALETYQPELYQKLVQSNGLACFDAEAYFSGDSFTKLSDGRIVHTY